MSCIIMSFYNKEFYDSQEKGSLDSAREILPIILRIINPKSVIDVGCGLGTWLSVFKELGIDDILGMDGKWVDENRLHIPKENFITADLENPLFISKKFDLAMSLEVAEHINEKKSENFVRFLTGKAPVILFSAAMPLQGGTNHINEQLPDYWIKMFKKYNYQPYDCIRGEIWENNNIEVWYIQNILLFVENEYLDKNDKLKKELESMTKHPYSIIHPDLYSSKIREYDFKLKKLEEECDKLKEQQKIQEKLEIKNNKLMKKYETNIESQEKLIDDLLSSNSWKITKPLRKIVNHFKMLKS